MSAANVRSALAIHLVLLGLMIALSVWGAFALPADVRVPVHWNVHLEPDRWGGKTEVLVFAPAVSAFLAFVLAVAPQLDPRGRNVERSFAAYRTIWLATASLFTVLHIEVVGSAAGWPVNVESALAIALAFLLIAIGNVMGKVRSNHLMGVRTPWTLASEEVWTKTNRATGRLFVIVGIAGFLLALASTLELAFATLVLGALATGVFSFVHSYVTWRHVRREKEP